MRRPPSTFYALPNMKPTHFPYPSTLILCTSRTTTNIQDVRGEEIYAFAFVWVCVICIKWHYYSEHHLYQREWANELKVRLEFATFIRNGGCRVVLFLKLFNPTIDEGKMGIFVIRSSRKRYINSASKIGLRGRNYNPSWNEGIVFQIIFDKTCYILSIFIVEATGKEDLTKIDTILKFLNSP